MKTQMRTRWAGLWMALALFYVGCSSESTSRLEVRLTDSPGDYQEVNIDVQSVQVNASAGNSGWVTLDTKAGVYDLLKLTNGLDTLLGVVELPAGKVEQIRLILGTNNSVKINNESFSLATPSAQQSGLKLNLHVDLMEGITYKILLDFEVARSIVKKDNGNYSLKPVIRAVEEATSGAINGTILPIEATPAIYAIMGTDTLATTFADENGKFLLRGLDAGAYTVSLKPKDGFVEIEKFDVEVMLGQVTDLGVIEF